MALWYRKGFRSLGVGCYKAVLSDEGPYVFRILGPDGATLPEVDSFLLHLSRSGRSPYTLRSYALGLAHFCGWLRGRGQPLEHVTKRTIGEYVNDFGRGPKEGSCELDAGRSGTVNPLTRKPYPRLERQPRTVNHRLSVLSSFFEYRRRAALDRGLSPPPNPVPGYESPMEGSHGMPGRDIPRRGRRAEFRRREAKELPEGIAPELARKIIVAASSRRDKAILTLLWRTGQRIGDWSGTYGRHGVLGMSLHDLDERSGTVIVRLKGARDEHRVPVTEDFWPLWRDYLLHERGDAPKEAAWVGLRRGRGNPLSYAAFEASLRYAGGKVGANVNAHMFRHALARAIVDRAGLKVAQEVLGHGRISSTADRYVRVDERAMAEAVAAAERLFDLPVSQPSGSVADPGYVFVYDDVTLDELAKLTDFHGDSGLPRSGAGPVDGRREVDR